MEKEHKSSLNWMIAAGVVGADIGTSIFYGTGILFPIVGYLAPVFVLTTCLMMWFFKRTYEEGLALCPYNGGAYSLILRTLGRQFAVLAGTLTFISYLATASVSALSGAFYLKSLFPVIATTELVVLVSFIPIIVFALLNSRGIKEPAKLVTVVSAFHFLLLIFLSIWGLIYILFNFDQIHFHNFASISFSDNSLTFATLIYGFSAAFLGITGFESAAQIVEELEQPALKTVRRLYKTVIILVSITAPIISLLCLLILSKNQIETNLESLLSSLASTLGGKMLLSVVVIDATLTLFAAVNTAFVGFIGLATTMAKQGNLPGVVLTRFAHKHPTLQGYPLIAIPFGMVAMVMSATVAGTLDTAAKVYEISFLGVMVSFCIGVILMRNMPLRKRTPKRYLSKTVIKTEKHTIPLVPLFSMIVLFIACLTLLLKSDHETKLMLLMLFSSILIIKAFYRWRVLEKHIIAHRDLRLGAGKYSNVSELPNDLPKYILGVDGAGVRRMISNTLKFIRKERLQKNSSFELIIFHAEENKDPNGFYFEQLIRVVSQQIVPIEHHDLIVSVKILPGNVQEGLQAIKDHEGRIEEVFLGHSDMNRDEVNDFSKTLEKDLEIKVTTKKFK